MTFAIQPRTSPPVASLSASISPSIPHSLTPRPSSFALSTLYRLLRSSHRIALFVFNTLRTLAYSFVAPTPTVSALYKLFAPKYGGRGRPPESQPNQCLTDSSARKRICRGREPAANKVSLFCHFALFSQSTFFVFNTFWPLLQKQGGGGIPRAI